MSDLKLVGPEPEAEPEVQEAPDPIIVAASGRPFEEVVNASVFMLVVLACQLPDPTGFVNEVASAIREGVWKRRRSTAPRIVMP